MLKLMIIIIGQKIIYGKNQVITTVGKPPYAVLEVPKELFANHFCPTPSKPSCAHLN